MRIVNQVGGLIVEHLKGACLLEIANWQQLLDDLKVDINLTGWKFASKKFTQ